MNSMHSIHMSATCDDVIRCYSDILRDRAIVRDLLVSPGIEQRTPEWYAARDGLITASDFAQALGQGKFGTQKDFFVKKVRPDSIPGFDPNASPALKWGVMFEPVANDIYSGRNGGIAIHEFGLLRHPKIPHIGASPDGITDAGVMVEIKCPFQRRINGEVPHQYYCQIQGQLAVCGLRRCDYLECEFEKYKSREFFEEDCCGCSCVDPRGLGSGSMEHQKHSGYSEVGTEKGAVAEIEVISVASVKASVDNEDGTQTETETETEKKETVYRYSPLPYSFPSAAEYRNALERWHDSVNAECSECHECDGSNERPESSSYRRQKKTLIGIHYWKLKTYSVIRIDADPEMTGEMLMDLERIWQRVVRYRSDPEAFNREILAKNAFPPYPATGIAWYQRSDRTGDKGLEDSDRRARTTSGAQNPSAAAAASIDTTDFVRTGGRGSDNNNSHWNSSRGGGGGGGGRGRGRGGGGAGRGSNGGAKFGPFTKEYAFMSDDD